MKYMKIGQVMIVALCVLFKSTVWGQSECDGPDLKTTRDYINKKIADIPMLGPGDQESARDPQSMRWNPTTDLLFYQYIQEGSKTHKMVRAKAPIFDISFTASDSTDNALNMACNYNCWICSPDIACEHKVTYPRDRSYPFTFGDVGNKATNIAIRAPNAVYRDKLQKALKHLQCLAAEYQRSRDDDPF